MFSMDAPDVFLCNYRPNNRPKNERKYRIFINNQWKNCYVYKYLPAACCHLLTLRLPTSRVRLCLRSRSLLHRCRLRLHVRRPPHLHLHLRLPLRPRAHLRFHPRLRYLLHPRLTFGFIFIFVVVVVEVVVAVFITVKLAVLAVQILCLFIGRRFCFYKKTDQ